jgi:hypothetical protein
VNLRQRIIWIVITYPFVIYAIAYVSAWLNPYWDDNSPIAEYIPRSERWVVPISERWVLALLISLPYFVWGIPLLFMGISIVIYLFNRRN